MLQFMMLASIVLLLCVLSSKFFYRFGVPSLLIFLILGMIFGSDGLVGIKFNNFALAKDLCSIGLIFIMFFGGFGTNWSSAKPVAIPAILMSTLGVFVTAGLTGLFCHFVLHLTLLEGLLIGAIVASTDAASVFSILRSRKLNLKNGLAPLLEIESGSNDPFAYMLTLLILVMMGTSTTPIAIVVIKQVVFAFVVGLSFAYFGGLFLRKIVLEIEGLYPIFTTAIALLSFSLAEYLGGNGFLSVYILGLILGNSKIIHKRSLVHFFDGISWLMQIMLFFTLGLLSLPSKLPGVIIPGVLVALFLIIVARPIATISILTWFKFPLKQQLLVSWVGLRGAASIVFAIYAMASGIQLESDLFHLIFFVALFSVAVQGTLMPWVAKGLDLIITEKDSDAVLKTFNDYQDEMLNEILELKITESHPWAGKSIMEADIPLSILVLMIKRNREYLMPKGYSTILPNDILLLSGDQVEEDLKYLKNVGKLEMVKID